MGLEKKNFETQRLGEEKTEQKTLRRITPYVNDTRETLAAAAPQRRALGTSGNARDTVTAATARHGRRSAATAAASAAAATPDRTGGPGTMTSARHRAERASGGGSERASGVFGFGAVRLEVRAECVCRRSPSTLWWLYGLGFGWGSVARVWIVLSDIRLVLT